MSKVNNCSLLSPCRDTDLALPYLLVLQEKTETGIVYGKSLNFKFLGINFKMFLNTFLENTLLRTTSLQPLLYTPRWPIGVQHKLLEKLFIYFKNKIAELLS